MNAPHLLDAGDVNDTATCRLCAEGREEVGSASNDLATRCQGLSCVVQRSGPEEQGIVSLGRVAEN